MAIEVPALTVEDANRRLPLVRAIVQDAIDLKADVVARQERLLELRDRYPDEDDEQSPYSEEVDEMEESLQADESRITEYAEELGQVGAELVDAVTGLVEFVSTLDGQTVRLSWLFNEPEVSHWRAEDEEPYDRKPLELSAAGESS